MDDKETTHEVNDGANHLRLGDCKCPGHLQDRGHRGQARVRILGFEAGSIRENDENDGNAGRQACGHACQAAGKPSKACWTTCKQFTSPTHCNHRLLGEVRLATFERPVLY